MKQALLQRASVRQQEVLAIPSTPASASLPPPCQRIQPHRGNACTGPQVPPAPSGPLWPQGSAPTLTSCCFQRSWHLPYNGFCLGSSGNHIARTISKSQIKTAVLKVLQVSCFVFCIWEECVSSASVALDPCK